jgi:hypothetical protein
MNPPWEVCRFGPDGLLDVPNVHDNFVYAVTTHLEQKVLILYTEYRDDPGPHELTDLRFLGTVVHFFDDFTAPSILLDVELVRVARVGELFTSRKNHGWPLPRFDDLPDLTRQLEGLGVVGYRVMGSCGMDGFILAASGDYRHPVQVADFGV